MEITPRGKWRTAGSRKMLSLYNLMELSNKVKTKVGVGKSYT
jgi:hypothetical protein